MGSPPNPFPTSTRKPGSHLPRGRPEREDLHTGEIMGKVVILPTENGWKMVILPLKMVIDWEFEDEIQRKYVEFTINLRDLTRDKGIYWAYGIFTEVQMIHHGCVAPKF